MRGKTSIVGCCGLFKVASTTICVAVDDIAGDDATAGPSDGATAGNDAGSHWC